MYLQQCTIRNIKCFDNITLDFRNPDGGIRLWNVLIGENGTGKTTLLQAMAMALMGEKAASVLLPRPQGWVQSGAPAGEIAATILGGHFDLEVAWANTEAGQRLGMPLELRYQIIEGKSSTTNNGGATIREQIAPDFERLSHARSPESIAWFAAGYGPFRRLSGGSEQVREIMSSESYRREARFVTLFREDAALSDCADWLMQLDYARRDETNPDQQRDADLLESVQATLNDYLLPENVRLASINSQGVFFRTPYAEKVPLSALSDGYRAMLALVIDLLRHASQSYNLLLTVPDWLRQVHGVVLIDELDAHLHPTWQRQIGTWLKGHFPRLQFIVATHSPFITQVADDGGLYTLRRPNEQAHVVEVERDTASVRGWRVEQILAILFDTPSVYNPETEQRLREYGRLKLLAEMNQLPAAQAQRFAELQAWVDRYLAPPGNSRTEMLEFEALDQRIRELRRQLDNKY